MQGPRVGQKSATVLLVDDETNVVAALQTALRKYPFRFLTASSGSEALAVLKEHHVDAIVSDYKMVGVSGTCLLSQVRQLYPMTVRIMLSGHADSFAMLDAINDAQVFRFLLKPSTPDEIAAAITDGMAVLEKESMVVDMRAERTLRSRFQSASRLTNAIERLWMVYQPIVRAPDRSIFAFEALVRSDEPQFSSPPALLAAATEQGRIFELEQAIRRRVSSDLSNIPESTAIFVNLQPQSLDDPMLYAPDSPLARYAHRIVFEMTESEDSGRTDALIEKLNALRAIGYRVAVDDLGSGYSSLAVFALVRPDFVKFDIDMIRGIDQSPLKSKLVLSMTTLCRELGIRSIAEGAETDAEIRAVTDLHCDLVQGFGIARPNLWSHWAAGESKV